ncbi:HAMP domain-containing histidine kinase [Calothrix sp. FACHB-1219]|uniref:sensor histidine kinase n=1 Tax=unclassified Calothrix TaxID=2619626 RepID=UPI001685CC68|nr:MULTISPECIES: HAMP domain-containing sensor histidine kinase [unclassified Calothrix]MBD2204977.1 HAMP domain-containing histidine kinase [Calothrix sp. FACHB-168]MBD2216199.1 HAMP domain-containing histidine kinase [Calothrix sp. FACHB-1219]
MINGENTSNSQATTTTDPKPHKGFFWAARTRILFWYVLILGIVFVVFIPAFRQVLYARVNSRVQRENNAKMRIFEDLITGQPLFFGEHPDSSDDNKVINELKESDNRLIQPPTSKKELKDFFDGFLGTQIPEDDTYLIALIEGKFYKSSPRARPKELSRDSEIMRYFGTLTQAKEGEKIIPGSPVESIVYLAQPVKIQGEVMGVFVIAHPTFGERGEVVEAVAVIVQVGAAVVVLALILAWFASGKILAPLRLLNETACNITASDLNQRIVVSGQGELAELAVTFNAMMDRLQNAFISQRNFINDAGHELRTPITIIRGHLELMGNHPEEIEETLALVMDELERMNRFVNDMILLAKAEHPDFLHLETVDVCALTEELYAKIQALGDRNWRLQATAKCKIVADRQRLTQAVMNLVQNATQHTTDTDSITLGSAIHQDKVSFWVHDTGEGIAEAEQQRIFQRFARSANSRRRSEGAGLGLSIVQAIAVAHGGHVTVKSKQGAGAKFTIILPLEPPQERK